MFTFAILRDSNKNELIHIYQLVSSISARFAKFRKEKKNKTANNSTIKKFVQNSNEPLQINENQLTFDEEKFQILLSRNNVQLQNWLPKFRRSKIKIYVLGQEKRFNIPNFFRKRKTFSIDFIDFSFSFIFKANCFFCFFFVCVCMGLNSC